MKTILLTLMAAATVALAADNNTAKDSGPQLTLEPYGVVSWTGINGAAELGAGLNLGWRITENLSIVGFGESDDTKDTFVDRFGAGLRYTAWLGNRFSLSGGVGGGYDTTDPHFFVRLPVSANLYAIRSKNIDVALTTAYAFDIDGNGKHGSATGRFFFGPTANWKF